MEKRFVYADNAATTPVTPAVLEAMTPWLMENYGNPSSIYSIGRAARTAKNPATGATIDIPASKPPAFMPSKAFKDSVQ